MISISLCMIVKNEEENLSRCLDSVSDLVDEIVIVDTGSTDRTKEIAAKYTSRIYDFEWIDDFAAARNFAFSKASMEYIYSCDADETLDEENRKKFRILKENLLPEIEIVQMLYVEKGIRTVLNFETELRPKLYKRLRTFTWVDPIHETVRLTPVVFDSDIEIQHNPSDVHSGRDFEVFEKAYARDGFLSENILQMYCKELAKWGGADEFQSAAAIFRELEETNRIPADLTQEVYYVLSKAAYLRGAAGNAEDLEIFFKYAMKLVGTGEPCSEICALLSEFYAAKEDYAEAAVWMINALYETECIMDTGVKSDENREKLIDYCHYAADLAEQKGQMDAQGYYLELAERFLA